MSMVIVLSFLPLSQIDMLVRSSHPENAYSPSVTVGQSMVTAVKSSQLSNAASPKSALSPVIVSSLSEAYWNAQLSSVSVQLSACTTALSPMHTPPQEYSMTAEGGALVPREWCIHSGEMVHGGRRRGAPSRHAGAYSGRALRLRMDSPSICIVYAL